MVVSINRLKLTLTDLPAFMFCIVSVLCVSVLQYCYPTPHKHHRSAAAADARGLYDWRQLLRAPDSRQHLAWLACHVVSTSVYVCVLDCFALGFERLFFGGGAARLAATTTH